MRTKNCFFANRQEELTFLVLLQSSGRELNTITLVVIVLIIEIIATTTEIQI